jgi:hypothetical protein
LARGTLGVETTGALTIVGIGSALGGTAIEFTGAVTTLGAIGAVDVAGGVCRGNGVGT